MRETRIILSGTRGKDEEGQSLASYRASGGYRALEMLFGMKPVDVIDAVKRSGLRGRGGAGFPTGLKWSFIKGDTGAPVYIICNADEGEPGTFKDRVIMESTPHTLIEGLIIAAHAIKARRGFIYIRGEFHDAAAIMEKAIEEARMAGLLGNGAPQSGHNFDIRLFRGAGAYICGDETALIESLEGKRGYPRLKPPFPAEAGLYGSPTVVNNVETLACLPYILREGPEKFASLGKPQNTGTKLFSISGDVKSPGCYEYPLGVSLQDLIFKAAGGLRDGQALKGVIPGGLSAPILTAEEAHVDMDFDSLAHAGTMLGSGGVIVIGSKASIPEITACAARFFAAESCGQCTPCREGTRVLRVLLDRISQGRGEEQDLGQVLRLCGTMKGICLCPLGDSAALALKAFVSKYRADFVALLKNSTPDDGHKTQG
jgi:NADH-quinone oxidoreductase subunit F